MFMSINVKYKSADVIFLPVVDGYDVGDVVQ